MIPKIYECISKDEQLRKPLCHACVTKKKIVASDAHVLIAFNTEEVLGKQFVDALPDEEIFFNNAMLRDMAKPDVEMVVLNGNIKVLHQPRNKEGWVSEFELLTQEQVGNYPRWEAILPEKNEDNLLPAIGVNAKLLSKLQNAMGPDVAGLALYFNGPTKAIICEPINSIYESVTAIIMPMMIST